MVLRRKFLPPPPPLGITNRGSLAFVRVLLLPGQFVPEKMDKRLKGGKVICVLLFGPDPKIYFHRCRIGFPARERPFHRVMHLMAFRISGAFHHHEVVHSPVCGLSPRGTPLRNFNAPHPLEDNKSEERPLFQEASAWSLSLAVATW